MAGPHGPGTPAARWKRHIVRQLQQRDRAQKALFLELVPACECAPGDWKRSWGPAGALGDAWFGPSSVIPDARRASLASDVCLVLLGLLSGVLAPSEPGSVLSFPEPQSPGASGRSLCP